MTETKKKEKGLMRMESGHIMICSGVQMQNTVAAGVGFLIYEKLVQKVLKRHCRRNICGIEQNRKNIVSIYGPNKNNKVKVKVRFRQKLTSLTEEATRKI